MSWFVIFLPWIATKKITIHDKKITNGDFFLPLGMPLIAMCLDTQAASKKKESVGRVRPLHHLVGTVSMRLSVSLRLCPCAPIRLVMMCAVWVMGRSTYRCVVSVTCVFARVSPAAAEILAVLQTISGWNGTSVGPTRRFSLQFPVGIQPKISNRFFWTGNW